MFLSAARRLRADWIAVLLALTGPCFAWVYPEHRAVAVLSVQLLDPQHAAAFDKLWTEARAGYENRLCELPAVADQGTAPLCLDWAALLTIAGDQSCSSKDMLDTVLPPATCPAPGAATRSARAHTTFYNANGLDVLTWDHRGGRLVIMGNAHMRP